MAVSTPPKAAPKIVKKGGTPLKGVKVLPSGEFKVPAALIRKITAVGLLVVSLVTALIFYELRKNAAEDGGAAKKEDAPQKAVEQAKAGIIAKKNSPPEIISITLTPSNPVKGDKINVGAATRDSDNDPVTLSYQWTINGTTLPGNDSDTLSADFKKGDTISVTVTPFDGTEKGPPLSASTIIFNAPPVIISSVARDATLKDVFRYQVKAEDPDGDPLTYSVISVPEKMDIDPATGLIKWSIPEGFKGKASAIVTVRDSDRGEATQVFNIQVGER